MEPLEFSLIMTNSMVIFLPRFLAKVYMYKVYFNGLLNALTRQCVCALSLRKTNYGSETVIPLYITGCIEKIYYESAVVTKRRRLIRVKCFLTTVGDMKMYHCLRTIISLVSGFFFKAVHLLTIK